MQKTITYHHHMDMITELIHKDPRLKSLFERVEQVTVTLSSDYFLSLVSAIISQQLSGKVAQIIYRRFLDFYNQTVTPLNIIQTDDEALRSLGISYQKIKYLKSLASHIVSNEIDLSKLVFLEDEEIIETLIKVKGIGRWTAQMFLMFSLGKEDVAASLDLGLRKAYSRLLGEEVSIKQFERISETWRPYRSIVSHFLWHSVDKPKEENA